MTILSLIGTGHRYARTASELAVLSGMSERNVRWEINRLRREKVILNLMDGEGYFIPEDCERELVMRYRRQEAHRAKEIGQNLKAVDEWLSPSSPNIYRSARMLKGATQAETFRATGIPVYALSQIENGRAEPTEEQKRLLSGFYGLAL